MSDAKIRVLVNGYGGASERPFPHPRYQGLLLQRQERRRFTVQDLRDMSLMMDVQIHLERDTQRRLVFGGGTMTGSMMSGGMMAVSCLAG